MFAGVKYQTDLDIYGDVNKEDKKKVKDPLKDTSSMPNIFYY
jgi:hypothetical protein